jgi:hypothetical protein
VLAVLKLEFIGENYHAYKKHAPSQVERLEKYGECLGRNKSRPWVALLTGFDSDRVQFVREFMRGQIDYSGANTTCSRGVYLYYPLKPGLYEVNKRETWTRVERIFIRVEGMDITEIAREEALRCLANNH